MTRPVGDVAAFLAARLDEDEARAWAVHDVSKCDALLYEDLPADEPLPHDCECGYPARVLREVAAKRAILAEYVAVRKLQERTGAEKDFYRDWVLRHLAAVYDDHPDYDPAWATASRGGAGSASTAS